MSRLRKSSENMWVSGILGGIGEYFGISEGAIDLLRILFILITVGTMFPGVIIYIILLFIMPED